MSRVGGVIIAGSLLSLLAVPCCRRDDQSAPRDSRPVVARPNIILLTVDTLRADHVGLYGYVRDTMPTIETFAQSAVVFDTAVVPRGSTRASYSSMLTGLYPFHHGVRSSFIVLNDALTTLPEVLKSSGYHTAGFVSNYLMVAELSGFDQGFDVYDDGVKLNPDHEYVCERTADKTLQAILRWLEAGPPQPFLLFINFIDPHGPYEPPQRLRRLYRDTRVQLLHRDQIPPYQLIKGELNLFEYIDRYDEEIRYTDETIGALITALRRRGLWDTSFVAFAADHGESFGEHRLYFDHYFGVWESTVHVPLAIRAPVSETGQETFHPRRVGSLSSPMDLMPTILDYLDINCDVAFDGRSLLPLMSGEQDADRALLVEFPAMASASMERPDVYAVRTATHKLIKVVDQKTGEVQEKAVFDLDADPMEQHHIPLDPANPLHKTLNRRLESMMAEVRSYKVPFRRTVFCVPKEDRQEFLENREGGDKKVVKTLTDGQTNRLRSLGYVQ